MNLLFLKQGWDDYLYWLETDKTVFKKINEILKSCQRTLFLGIGKPEPLKFSMTGTWSRRITSEHRFVYKVQDDNIIVMQCRYHY